MDWKRRDCLKTNEKVENRYLAKKYTTLSLAGIGDVLGKKDHATVLHACKTISEQVGVDKKLRSDLEEIEQRIQG